MKLSVIIVNYNVQYFLQNCLYTVLEACSDIESEIFVVDNNSTDGSIETLKKHFKEVQLIHNKKNLGFSKANNQAINKAKGEYILLLNPDTVVEKDTFKKCIKFMDQHPKAGGLGVKMVDGSGEFLPESKRGLPNPSVAFFKIFGFSALFPKSKIFGKYHLGYIDKNEIAEIEILSGAYMFLRKKVLDEIGNLDESFFMYGEDIDLSWRIIKAGYKNFYYPETNIIHYKGESTKKSSVNYVFVFYRAMVIFAKKHFSKNNAQLFSIFINSAIYFRATVAIIERLIKIIALPLFDFVSLFFLMYGCKEIYEKEIKFTQGGEYPEEIIMFSLPLMAAIWVITNIIFGVYNHPSRINRLLRSISAGTIVILITYALLDESMRFSRALILIFSLSSLLILPLLRQILIKTGIIKKASTSAKRMAIVGESSETFRVKELLEETGIHYESIVKIDSEDNRKERFEGYVGTLNQLDDLIMIYGINEIIFCSADVSIKTIISHMIRLGKECDFKIAPPQSSYIIGSSSNETSGEYYVIGKNSITAKRSKNLKRMLDILVSSICLLLTPFMMVFFNKPSAFIGNMWKVLTGKLTLISLPKSDNELREELMLKPGILSPLDMKLEEGSDIELITIQRYYKQYTVWNDLEILIKGFGKLDQK